MMEKCVPFVCVLVLAGFLGRGMCASSPCFTGTRAVTWTLYAQIKKMTWNEASRFCKERGGYLPVTNTHITAAAFQSISYTWARLIWIGLHSAVSGEVPNVWEANCCLLPPDVQYWSTWNGEPNKLNARRCSRSSIDLSGWYTDKCSKGCDTVCEMDRGNCTYATLRDTTITTNPDASKAHVPDVSACWSLCLQLRHEGKECVAAVLEQTTVCKLYVGSSLLEEDQVLTSPRPDSVVMLRRCFLTIVSQESFPDFSFTDTSDSPAPANGACLAVDNTAVSTTDFLPPGVEPGLVTMATPPPISTTEEATEPETTTATSATTTTTPSSTAGVSTPETAATTTIESKTESGLMTTTNTATSPPTPPSTAVSTEAATSETPTAAAHVTPGDVTTASANVPKQRLCPCSCPFKHNPPRQLPASLLPVIPLNATSKKRRSKTSVKMADTSHSVVGAPWVVACGSVFCLLVLWDLNRFKRRLGKRSRRKNKVNSSDSDPVTRKGQ